MLASVTGSVESARELCRRRSPKHCAIKMHSAARGHWRVGYGESRSEWQSGRKGRANFRSTRFPKSRSSERTPIRCTFKGRRGTLIIRELKTEWVDVLNDEVHGVVPAVVITRWTVVRGTGQYARVTGRRPAEPGRKRPTCVREDAE